MTPRKIEERFYRRARQWVEDEIGDLSVWPELPEQLAGLMQDVADEARGEFTAGIEKLALDLNMLEVRLRYMEREFDDMAVLN